MAISLTWESGGIYFEATGTISKEELHQHIIEECYNDVRSVEMKYELFDCSSADEIQISEQDIIYFVAADIGRSKLCPQMQIAIVRSEDARTNHLLQKYVDASRLANRGWDFKTFETLVCARSWINTRIAINPTAITSDL